MENNPVVYQFNTKIYSQKYSSMDFEGLQKYANLLASQLGLNVVKTVVHQFPNHGVTLVLILSQSHLVIHTWPEFNCLHIDLVSCKSLTQEEFELGVNNIFSTV